jgi:hypothetical protein
MAQKHKEMQYSESVAYRDAVLGAVVESPQVSSTAKAQIRTVIKGAGESGFRVGSTGAPLPPNPPAGCYWDRYVLDGNLMDDIFKINDLNSVSSSDLGQVNPIDPLTQEYYVKDWEQVGGDIYRLICIRDRYGINPPPYRPPIDF